MADSAPPSNEPSGAGLVLASGSATRQAMLRQAGLDFEVETAAVDESEIKNALRADGAKVHDVAEALAEVKAMRVSRLRTNAFVVGADQMLECGDAWVDKPTDRASARAQLLALRGKAHRLVSSVVVVQNGSRAWHHTEAVSLTVRPFSEAFLDDYLDRVGDRVLSSVGGYQLEGPGAQLFSRIQGDYFTVLGLPLLPLLGFLRLRGVLRD